MPGVQIDLPIIGDSLLAHHPDNIEIHDSCFHSNLQTLSPASTFPHNPRPRRSHGSLSFLSSSPYRSEYLELPVTSSRRTMDRATVSISPFRSVRQMKEPFQLKLPNSPSFDTSPIYPIPTKDFKDSKEKENKAPPRVLQSPIGLRPLRTCRSDQNLVAGALHSFGLLPSPSLSDSQIPRRTKPEDILIMEDIAAARKQRKCSCTRSENCEVCFIETYNTEKVQLQPPTDLSVVKSEKEIRDSQPGSSKMPTTEPTSTPHVPPTTSILSPMSSTNSKKRTRTATVSSATSWVPGDLTYCESWLQGVPLETPERNDEKARESNRRKYQIVQQTDEPLPSTSGLHGRRRTDLRIDTDTAKNPVMLAIASKTKPKLVEISRPSSSGTTFSVPIHPPPSWRRPSTPERRSINEISAFSPDTPQDVPDSGYVTQQSNRSSDESNGFHDEDYVDGPLDIHSSSDPPGNLPFAIDLFTEKLSVKNGYVSCYKRQYAPSYPRKDPPGTPPAVSPRTVEQESLAKWWDYEWTLDQLEESIKEFPKQTLRLTSPVIILIRQNHEKALLRPFRKIFSGVPDNLIDYLCAALVAKNYLVSMAATHHKSNNPLSPPLAQGPTNNLSRLDSVPEKARATLGIALPMSNKFQIADRLMGTRSHELQKGLDRIISKLLYTICGRHDETLKASLVVLMQVLEEKA